MTETLEGRRAAQPAARPNPPPLPAELDRRTDSLRRLPLSGLGVAAASLGVVLLAFRLVADVRGKPLFEDEAVAGLVAARPLGEIFQTVWWERGGPPLHFVLSHLTLLADSSPYGIRWLSVVFSLAAVPVSWDLGRRLGGHVAAGTAALVVAASPLLAVYGAFGRMYSLYVFAAALALDFFVRALHERTRSAAFGAALAAWILPAVHPSAAILVAAEAIVALAVWRGRNLRAALPVGLVGLALVPFLIADVRLAQRFSVGFEGGGALAGPSEAWRQVARAFEATAGGSGWTLAVAAAVALAGFLSLAARGERAVVALVALGMTLPPVLLLAARSSGEAGVSPRHIAFLVPLFAALIGVGTSSFAHRLGARGGAVALAAVAVVLVASPVGGVTDPRDWPNDVLGGGPAGIAVGSPERVAPAAAWLEREVRPDDVLFPYSVVYLAALPATRHATTLPYAQTETVLRALDRVRTPARRLFVSVPVGQGRVDFGRLEALVGDRFHPVRLGPWLIVRGGGPYRDGHAVLLATYTALAAVRSSMPGPLTNQLDWYYRTTLSVLCGSLRTFGERCPPRSLAWLQPEGPASARPRLGG